MQNLSMNMLELMDLLPGVVFSIEAGGEFRLQFVSDSIHGLLGYSKKQFTSDPTFWLNLVHSFDRQHLLDDLEDIVNRKVLSQEYRFLHREGHSLWVRAEMKLIADSEGETLGIVGFWTDVSERHLLEENLRESEERWKYALEGSGQGVWDWNLSTDEVFCSLAYKSMLGYADDDITDHLLEWLRLIHPEDRVMAKDQLDAYLSGRNPVYCSEYRMLCRDGDYKWVLDQGKVVKRDEQGRPIRMIGTHADISGHRLIMEKLSESEQRYRNLFQLSPVLTAIINMADGTYLEVNDAFLNTMGFKREEIIGRRPEDLNIKIEPSTGRGLLKDVLQHGSIRNKEITFKNARGKTHTGLYFAALVVIDGKDCLLSVALDISERKKYEERIRYQAYHDLLTGLPNRRFFEERLRYVVADARRLQEKVAVLFLDLDGFKQVNDILGHETGDKVLRDTAAALKGCLRETDTVARLGGDEFMIILPHLKTRDDARPVIERILKTCRKTIVTENISISISVSIGAAFYPDDGTKAAILMKNADIAMYRAKDAGRDQAACY